ncbi:hypothetical protein [Celeribacter neptunius]|uniref:hypothetical protein n=1 Tax=Celeribacter neptunius TaxID=588602 RepID=UPI0015A5E8F6|nr:hypothetical protein [Celeribacter neptunius]
MSEPEIAETLARADPKLKAKLLRRGAPDWLVRIMGLFDSDIRADGAQTHRLTAIHSRHDRLTFGAQPHRHAGSQHQTGRYGLTRSSDPKQKGRSTERPFLFSNQREITR